VNRNGRFLLRSPSTLLANSVLNEMEDALNRGSSDQGNVVPVDVFLSLRSKSLLHVFASIGTSLNLKVISWSCFFLSYSASSLQESLNSFG
jgi:mediator of RNA polymerase II transcription subunit 14